MSGTHNGQYTSSSISANLQSITEYLYIQLFGEVVVDVLDDDRQRETSLYQRFGRYWLGGMQIPFQVIYKWSKVINLPSELYF